MANLAASKKAIRVTKRKTSRNEKARARLSRLTRKTLKLIQMGEEKLARQQLQATQKAYDKAAKSNMIHPNKAKRVKSSLSKKVNSIKKDVKTAPKNS